MAGRAGRKRVFGIVGLGNFGRAVAGELSRFGCDTIGVDVDPNSVDEMVETLSRALIADARDPAALREAGLDNAMSCWWRWASRWRRRSWR